MWLPSLKNCETSGQKVTGGIKYYFNGENILPRSGLLEHAAATERLTVIQIEIDKGHKTWTGTDLSKSQFLY